MHAHKFILNMSRVIIILSDQKQVERPVATKALSRLKILCPDHPASGRGGTSRRLLQSPTPFGRLSCSTATLWQSSWTCWCFGMGTANTVIHCALVYIDFFILRFKQQCTLVWARAPSEGTFDGAGEGGRERERERERAHVQQLWLHVWCHPMCRLRHSAKVLAHQQCQAEGRLLERRLRHLSLKNGWRCLEDGEVFQLYILSRILPIMDGCQSDWW